MPSWIARLVIGALLALAATGAAMAEGRRLALVIGNGAYDAFAPLDNAVNDANAMARALRAQDFDVTLLTDVGTEVFEAVLDTFARQSEGAETVLFYYAGHAFQMNGVNHLVPISTHIDSVETAISSTWKLDDIAARLKGGTAQLLIFLDACRTNPLPQGLAIGGDGLAQFDGGAGTFVAFATRPSAVAYDGGPDGSPFTRALVQRIAEPGQSLSDLMIAVRNDVQQATAGAQVPWEQSSLRAQFHFAPAQPAPAQADALPAFDVVQSASTIAAPGARAMPETATPPQVDPPAIVVSAVAPGLLPALSSETRGIEALSPLAPAADSAPRLAHVDPAQRVVPVPEASPVIEPPPAPQASARFATAADLARATQEELKRIGCYTSTVDGDWGNGSRRALGRYYDAVDIDSDALTPTEALYDALTSAPAETCKPVAAAAPVPKKATASKSASAKPARNTTAKPAPVKKAPAPAATTAKKKVECKWVVVAIVCK